MERLHITEDDSGKVWQLREPVMNLNRPMVRIEGAGVFLMPSAVFELQAVDFLRSRGYLVIASKDVRFVQVEVRPLPPMEPLA